MVEIDYIAAIREITPDDPEAIEPAPPAGDEAGDGQGIRADLRRQGARIDEVEADAHRVALDLRREFHRGALDLRDEFQRGLRDHAGEVGSLKALAGFQGLLLGVLVVVLTCVLFSAAWWTGAMHARGQGYDHRLGRIEDDSARRHEALGLRLDELKAAIRQAGDRPTPAR